MRFNNNLFLLASFFGAATAFRRTCTPDTTSDVAGTGCYTLTESDLWENIAADFCTNLPELKKMNPGSSSKPGEILKVPCQARKRDCSRIPGQGYGYYTVVESDDLALIAMDFCIDTLALQRLNPKVVTGYKVAPGVVLEVPCAWN
ncbi:uncharacterized protein L3040_001184 [Drepanopeziza brunnea f. sp. 'multigermtubi']|uniref:LysM21p n=2 Tax=Drepanopeziza brunnea f. sp. 'multigermtubi' TaxID=698441 RepID=J9XN83_9HELO|nr:putative Ecp7(P20) [Drepanopeziza brunnea f. sp. 'multigermtubi' MB_m1]AFS30739.1 LysM21p [Drepanopeziza brunnea f. sp. 'multigermtubi']EKD16901.1 putative Ecp7(P20) [Drepanopeziza brunnea f. sp. 'multigermtubi' MB_m1]KAJ5054922.1 hypothetical protein L3040_001184 [Drepanopeziza brunnea f. sp. 'multigermtubi']